MEYVTNNVSFALLFRRTMAGGFNPKMAVQKNKYLEAWNGKREITEKSFQVNENNTHLFVLWILVFPYGVYTWTRSEFLSRGDRRYKELV